MHHATRNSTPPPPQHAVIFEGRRFAIPFGRFDAAVGLAKRATRDGNPARAVDVYEDPRNPGTFRDSDNHVVVFKNSNPSGN